MSNNIDFMPDPEHPWTMEDVRAWVADNTHIPDDFRVMGTLPEYPRHWARAGGALYTNDLHGLQTDDPEDFK